MKKEITDQSNTFPKSLSALRIGMVPIADCIETLLPTADFLWNVETDR